MGSELVVRRWCDRCRAPEEEGFRAQFRLTIGPEVDRVLDLCRSCFADILGPVIDGLGALGEVAKVKGKGANVAASQAAPKAAQPTLPSGRAPRTPPDPAERQQCPFCPKQPSSENGLKQHLKAWHGITWTQYVAGEPPTRGHVQEAVA